jgi:hypothetical protein
MQAGAGVSSGCSLWQVTEPLPLLSAEPALAEGLLEDGQALIELVNSVDIAINALLNGQQVGAWNLSFTWPVMLHAVL